MSNGQQVVFNGAQGDIALDASVTGLDASVQGALVMLGSAAGSDGVWTDKGTNLLAEALSGGALSDNQAIHISNIAAVDCTLFIRQNTIMDGDSVSNILLQPATVVNGGSLQLTASFTAVNGQTRPIQVQLS